MKSPQKAQLRIDEMWLKEHLVYSDLESSIFDLKTWNDTKCV